MPVALAALASMWFVGVVCLSEALEAGRKGVVGLDGILAASLLWLRARATGVVVIIAGMVCGC